MFKFRGLFQTDKHGSFPPINWDGWKTISKMFPSKKMTGMVYAQAPTISM
jgi:hypothetical protein